MNTLKHVRSMVAVTLFGAFAAQGALASCNAPRTPTAIPDGRTAQMEAMLKTKASVEAYLQQVSDYMQCEKDALKLQEAKARQKEILNWFNDEVRAFKAVNTPVMKTSYR